VCVLSLILSAEEGWLHDTQTVTAVCVCVCSLLHVLSQVKSIQERPSGEVTWPEIGQIECIISGLCLVLFLFIP